LTFPIPAKNQKFIPNNILKIRKTDEYCNNNQEYINFSPKKIIAISLPKTKNNHDILIANSEAYL
jgi:hypothetical protein